jgi:hypothetical protein
MHEAKIRRSFIGASVTPIGRKTDGRTVCPSFTDRRSCEISQTIIHYGCFIEMDPNFVNMCGALISNDDTVRNLAEGQIKRLADQDTSRYVGELLLVRHDVTYLGGGLTSDLFAQMLQQHPHVALRNAAVVLLRTHVSGPGRWEMLQQTTRSAVKHNLLEAVVSETSSTVRRQLSDIIGTVAELSLPDYDELWPFVFNLVSHYNPSLRRVGLLCLDKLGSSLLKFQAAQLPWVVHLLQQHLSVDHSLIVPVTNVVAAIAASCDDLEQTTPGSSAVINQALLNLVKLVISNYPRLVHEAVAEPTFLSDALAVTAS